MSDELEKEAVETIAAETVPAETESVPAETEGVPAEPMPVNVDEHGIRHNKEEDPEATMDPLKRKKFSWRNFGGEGLIFSIIFHAVLGVIAVFLVVHHYVQPVEEEPDAFVSGAGGGSNGDRAERRMKPRNRPDMKQSKAKITSKSTTSTIALPEMPQMSMGSSFSTGMSAGDSSGMGGGFGGGIGKGVGVGVGNGKNFVSAFGRSSVNLSSVTGEFYDLKLKKSGEESKMKPKNYESMKEYIGIGRKIVKQKGTWDKNQLKDYFKSDMQLSAPDQIFIPGSNADGAPKAFGLKNEGQRWFVIYSGKVVPNKSGRIRLLGCADDIICVRLGRNVALDAGFDLMTGKEEQAKGPSVAKVLGVSMKLRPNLPGFGAIQMRTGPVVKVRKGVSLPFECLIGETPGGNFSALLLFEELDDKGEPVGKPKLFRLSENAPEDSFVPEIRNNPNWKTWASQVDLTSGGWVFRPTKKR